MTINILYKTPANDNESEVVEVYKIEKVEDKIYFFETCDNVFFEYVHYIEKIEILGL